MIELIGPEREKVLKLREALSSTSCCTGRLDSRLVKHLYFIVA